MASTLSPTEPCEHPNVSAQQPVLPQTSEPADDLLTDSAEDSGCNTAPRDPAVTTDNNKSQRPDTRAPTSVL